MNNFQLPHKLSELAQMALDDVAAVEKLEGYSIDMDDVFHAAYPDDGLCVVCAAGAVMVNRLGADRALDHGPRDFGPNNSNALLAIDSLRVGQVGAALGRLIHGYSKGVRHALDRSIAQYATSATDWRADMIRLVADLREAGL